MNLYVIAYPEIEAADQQRIQLFRGEYDKLHAAIPPHFTIVFAVHDMAPEELIQEVKKQTANTAAIQFCTRCAIANKDFLTDNYDIFLVPDEGFSQILKLHDKLYNGKLASHHRPDIAYLPHITIANASNAVRAKKLTAQWNEKDFEISGSIFSLDVVNYENGVITTLEKICLAE